MTRSDFVALKGRVDVSQVFLVFMSLVGDVARTAAALDLDPDFVDKLATDEGWKTKIQRVCMMSKGDKPGDYERGVNRALCFVQAHRLRVLIDQMLRSFDGLTPEQVADKLSHKDKTGNFHISSRFFADLGAAMEKAHAMSYHALGDTITERKERDALEGAEASASILHASLIAALNESGMPPVRDELTQGQDQIVKDVVAQAIHTTAGSSVTECPTVPSSPLLSERTEPPTEADVATGGPVNHE